MPSNHSHSLMQQVTLETWASRTLRRQIKFMVDWKIEIYWSQRLLMPHLLLHASPTLFATHQYTQDLFSSILYSHVRTPVPPLLPNRTAIGRNSWYKVYTTKGAVSVQANTWARRERIRAVRGWFERIVVRQPTVKQRQKQLTLDVDHEGSTC